MHGLNTDMYCIRTGPDSVFAAVSECLSINGCAPSSGGINCGEDERGFIHGGINVGLGCSGPTVKSCLDNAMEMVEDDSDYVCNHE